MWTPIRRASMMRRRLLSSFPVLHSSVLSGIGGSRCFVDS